MDGWIGSFHLGSIICCFFLRRDFFFHFNIARFSIIVVYISNVELRAEIRWKSVKFFWNCFFSAYDRRK